jgi:hypothetical protein
MQKTIAVLALAFLVLPSAAAARDDRLKFSIADAFAQPAAEKKLTSDVAFYFADAKHPEVLKDFGETMVNLKTNAVGKSDITACQWVFLSVAIELQKRAREMGGNAVIELESYYKKELFRSETQFMCGAGATVAGVALRGKVVKLAPAAGAARPAEPKPAEAKPVEAKPAQ